MHSILRANEGKLVVLWFFHFGVLLVLHSNQNLNPTCKKNHRANRQALKNHERTEERRARNLLLAHARGKGKEERKGTKEC